MEITQGNLTAVFTGLKATFSEAVQSAGTDRIEAVMEVVPSTSGTEIYPVATLLGDLEEVLDEVTITNIGAFVQSVENKTFARIVEVKRNDIADDNIGVYRPGVRQLGRRAAHYPLRLAAEKLVSGFADTWVDGQTVFSDSHEWPGGQSWDNLNNLALSSANVRYGDLDGSFFLTNDPPLAGFRLEEGWLIARDVPGLGCTVAL